MTRIWIYGMAIPALLGIATMAAVVLPGPGLTLTRLLAGGAATIAVQVTAAYIGSRAAVRREPTP